MSPQRKKQNRLFIYYMKKIIQSILLLASASSFVACNEKLNIAAPYKNITVVYGLLNMADTAHYVRIQKAFMDENQSAIDMAKVADSSFYNALNVVVKEYTTSGSLVTTIPLAKVDLANEGYAKEAGAFFNTPNYAFKFKHPLNPSYNYRLVVTNTNTGNVDSATTNILNNSDPTKFGIREWKSGLYQLSFQDIFLANGKMDETSFSADIPSGVGAVELILRFNWTDSNVATGVATKKFADFNTFSITNNFNPGVSTNVSFSAQNKSLFEFLNSAMGKPADANQYRYLDSCDMILYIAGVEYQRYRDLNANKGGLTANEIRPLYTNIKGKDVMGLLSTRTLTQKLQIPLTKATQDSLRSNAITRELNIRFY